MIKLAKSAEIVAIMLTAMPLNVMATEAESSRCRIYSGQKVAPVTFEAVAAIVSKLPNQKGEFESTTQFEARVAVSRNGQASTYIMQTPFDPKFATYDADAGILRVEAWAIDNITTRWSGVFGYGTPFYERVKFTDSVGENIDVVVTESKMVTGSYRASNAFGTTINVRKERRVTKAVFEREAVYGENLFFPPHPYSATQSYVIDEVPASPDVARHMKSTMRAALVIEPKAPFYATGKVDWGEPTLQAPTDIDESQIAIIADIQCVLILDDSGAVISSIPTR